MLRIRWPPSAGLRIESGKDNILTLKGFSYENYWVTGKDNGDWLMVFAGMQDGSVKEGAIVVIETTSDYRTILQSTIHLTPFSDGPVRIVDAGYNELSFVSDSGLLYIYNLESRIFTETPPGSNNDIQTTVSPDVFLTLSSDTPSFEGFTIIPLDSQTITPPGMATNTPTRTPTRTLTPTITKTPTRTPTITPTITPLPTYNPYP
jgi:hypothetical protein